MDKNIQLRHQLRKLSEKQVILNQEGEPENNGDLFEEILEIQERILENFGLPTNHPVYENYLYFKNPPTDHEIFNRMKLLHKVAIDYLMNNVTTEIQLLKDAQESQRNTFHVLAELSLPTHVYMIFVYEEILLKRRDMLENILQEFRFANQPDILNRLGRLEEEELNDENATVQIFEDIGLNYVRQFVFFIKNQTSKSISI